MDLKSRSSETAGAPLSIYTERDLHDLWELQRFRRERLLTEDAVPLAIEFPVSMGRRRARFPRRARPLRGAATLGRRGTPPVTLGLGRPGPPSGRCARVGDSPRRAPAGPFRGAAAGLPLLVLEPYLHGALPPEPARGSGDLDAMGEEWFVERRARLERALERDSADEVLYRESLVALGFKHNKAAMADLARQRPFRQLLAGGIPRCGKGRCGRARPRCRGGWGG